MRLLIDSRNSIAFSYCVVPKKARSAGLPSSTLALQRVAAHRAIAGAQLVGLQAVEQSQDLVRAATHVEVVHAHVLDGVVGVDDEGRPQRHAFGLVAHAELVDERAGHVAEAVVAELAELVVGGTAQQHGIALGELLRQLVEAHDLGRADEGEILRIEVNDLPLAREALLRDRLEGRDAVFFVVVEPGLHANDRERFQLVANRLHRKNSLIEQHKSIEGDYMEAFFSPRSVLPNEVIAAQAATCHSRSPARLASVAGSMLTCAG